MADLHSEILLATSVEQFCNDIGIEIQNQGGDELYIRCPISTHPDENRSASLNSESGLWTCFASTCGGKGNLITLAAESVYAGNRDDARDWIKTRYNIGNERKPSETETIPQDAIDRAHSILIEQASGTLEALQSERGLSLEMIRRYKLGRGKDGRVSIPIHDQHGRVVNVRRWMPESQRKGNASKIISFKRGFGKVRWFPFDQLAGNELVVLCGGEMDALCALSNGIPAATVTGGEGTMNEELMAEAREAGVQGFYVCYDNDEGGRQGSERVTKMLHEFGFRIYNVALPEDVGDGGDVTDYFVKLDASGGDFRNLMNAAPLFELATETPRDDTIYPVTLNECHNAFYLGKRVKANVLISGRTDRVYMFPSTVQIDCAFETYTGSGRPSFCPPNCEQLNHGGSRSIELLSESREPLKLIRCSDAAQKAEMREIAGIQGRCGRWEWTAGKSSSMSEVVVRPVIKDMNEQMQNVVMNLFYEGHTLMGNNRYEITGRVWATPWTQETTLVMSDAKPLQADVGGFEMTDELHEALKIFQSDEPTTKSVMTKLEHIWDEFGAHAFAMRIVGRRDVISVMDLVYHSALYFRFASAEPVKGWLNAFLIGDTGTAKSEIAEGMIKWFGLGERVAFENASAVGITIATKSLPNGGWYSEWGTLCLNDRRLCVLDEIGERADELELLTDILSSGVVKTAKVEKDESYARTRIIVLTNPRKGTPQHMAQYDFGIQAVQRFFRKVEDIRRYDAALTVLMDEVDNDEINTKVPLTGSCAYPRELCRQLVLWAWTREEHQIVFEPDAEERIFDDARALSAAYMSDVPLISASDARLKLARWATAVAIRTFSTEDGEHVLVKECHADAAASILCGYYDKDGMRFGEYASRYQNEMMLNPADTERAVRDVCTALVGSNEIENMTEMEIGRLDMFVNFMQGSSVFRMSQLQQSLNMERNQAQDIIAVMTQRRLVNAGTRGYIRTSGCVRVTTAIRHLLASETERRDEEDVADESSDFEL